MSVSLDYRATRDRPLSPDELEAIRIAIHEAGDPPLEEEDDPWEVFSVFQIERANYQPADDREIMAGSTKVFEEEQVEHWLELLAGLRTLLGPADWRVTLDGEVEFSWDPEAQTYLFPDE